MITMLLGFAGLSVDLGNWYLHIQQSQRAADAASLDGDPYLPANVPAARNAAKRSLLHNGVDPAVVTAAFNHTTCSATATQCIAQVPGHPTQLQVRVTSTVSNTFLRFFKASATNTFSRKAIADHQLGIQLGNGRNALGGSEPTTTNGTVDGTRRWAITDPYNGQYWVDVVGRDSAKQDGDRTLTDSCTPLIVNPAPHGTYSSPTSANPRCTTSNPEYNSAGRFFQIHVAPQAGVGNRKLFIQVYDPGYYRTGDGNNLACTTPWDSGVPRLTASGCPGDGPSDGNNGTAFTTTYALHSAASRTSSSLSTCQSYIGTDNASASMSDSRIGPYVHEWANVCAPITVNVNKGGDYYLEISTGAGNGNNDFAIRAGLSSTAAATSPTSVNVALSQQLLTISADTNMAVDNVFPTSGTARFPLAQVSSQWVGQPITFEFFDIGDSVGGAGYGNFTLLYNGSNAPGTCTISVLPGPGPTSATNCTFRYTQDEFNGQLVKFTWTPPSTYSCNPTGLTVSDGCYVYAQMASGGAPPDDTTTWSLDYPSMPLHIIK